MRSSCMAIKMNETCVLDGILDSMIVYVTYAYSDLLVLASD